MVCRSAHRRLGWLRRSQFRQQISRLSLEVARLGDQILHLAANRWTAFNSGASCEGVRLVAQVVRFPFAPCTLAMIIAASSESTMLSLQTEKYVMTYQISALLFGPFVA